MDGETVAGSGYPKLCITCGEPIMPRQNVIESLHGPYHGSPRTCVEGRDDSKTEYHNQ